MSDNLKEFFDREEVKELIKQYKMFDVYCLYCKELTDFLKGKGIDPLDYFTVNDLKKIFIK